MRITILFLSLFSVFSVNAQDPINVLFYNVENLFDTIDNPLTNDEEFTPSGKNNYTSARYATKCTNLAKVIDSSFFQSVPHIVGLCEVENEIVVEALRDKLGIAHHLDVIHFESPDQRGIDNALLYDTQRFNVLVTGNELIDLGPEERPTRGIVWAALEEKDTKAVLIFLVNHWPSRYGGQEASNWKRVRAAETAIHLVDSLKQLFPDAGLVLMGDLNDHPDNESVSMLETCASLDTDPCLVNMHKHLVGSDAGSHAYKGEWGILDQILVNQKLAAASKGWVVKAASGTFIKKQWMLYKSDADGLYFPSRTYGGTKYFGGYSDHLPAALVINYSR